MEAKLTGLCAIILRRYEKVTEALSCIFSAHVREKLSDNVRGRLRRQGRNQGYTRSWKKAYVTLTQDSKEIEFFEGMM